MKWSTECGPNASNHRRHQRGNIPKLRDAIKEGGRGLQNITKRFIKGRACFKENKKMHIFGAISKTVKKKIDCQQIFVVLETFS